MVALQQSDLAAFCCCTTYVRTTPYPVERGVRSCNNAATKGHQAPISATRQGFQGPTGFCLLAKML